MTTPFLFVPVFKAWDNSGLPLAGGLVYTYAAGSTTVLKATYSDALGTITNTNPVVLDATGSATIRLGPGAYHIVVTDLTGTTTIFDEDYYSAPYLTQSDVGALLYPITAAETSASITPTYYYYAPGDVRRYGADPTGVSDSTAAISAADLVGSISGQPVVFPAGTFRCASGFTKQSAVNWLGSGKGSSNPGAPTNATILKFYGSGVFINAVGTSGSRIICTIRDMRLDGTNSAAGSEALKMGWNQRSNPFLQSVHIYNWPSHGIHFSDQNWIVDFVDVEVDTCGSVTSNTSGIYKDASVDGGTFNTITFNNCIVENCGTASSTAGGINLQTTTATRAIYFNNCAVEGNLGTLQIYVTNTADLQFKNNYMEGAASAPGQAAFIELDGCKGGYYGGYLTGTATTAPLGLQLKSGSEMQVDAVNFAGWATAGLDIRGSSARVGHNPGLTTKLDSTAQIWGEVCPRFSANKNATDQTGIATATFTKVTFGTEEYDETGAFDNATNYRFTPVAVGRYQIDGAVTWKTAVDQTQIDISIYRNGSAYKSSHMQTSGTGTHTTVISAICDCRNTTDYFELFARQSSGSGKDISGAVDETYFMATLIK